MGILLPPLPVSLGGGAKVLATRNGGFVTFDRALRSRGSEVLVL
jgi:hypothetical protein